MNTKNLSVSRFNKRLRNALFNVTVMTIFVFSNEGYAQGFLEMPDILETPRLERESMLLDLDIPPVRDRDPDPEAGPRLNVTEFRIQGIVEFPELGITRKELMQQVESIRFDMMDEGRRTESGFTIDEITEMSQHLIALEKETQDRHVNNLDLQRFVFLVRDQLSRRGMTLGMIETVADTITRYYRERGFILAKAYIPKQQVRDGVVNLTLLLGELSRVKVDGNKRVSPKLIERTFTDDINQPVTSWKVEESLYLINDIPGVSAQGFFSPGEQVGDTEMTVKVNQEKWIDANLRLDNHGTETTSENRAYLDFYVHNPGGWGDDIYLAVLNTYDPDNSTYGAFRYSSFIFSPRWRASVGYSTNEFFSRNLQVGSGTTIEGQSTVADVKLDYHFKRSRVKNYSVSTALMDIDTEIDANGVIDETVKKASLSFNFDVLNQQRRQLYIGNFGIHSVTGDKTETFGTDIVDVDDVFATLDLTTLSFFRIPFTKYTTRFLSKTTLQYAGKSISNLNQISLTGAKRARGFGPNSLQADDGIYAGVDWIFSLPSFGGAEWWGESVRNIFQPYLFVDGGWGKIHPIVDDDIALYGRIADVGAGVKLNFKHLSGTIAGAKIVTDEIDGLEGGAEEKKFTLELQYKF